VIEHSEADQIRKLAVTVNVTLSVFGHDVRLLGSASAQTREEALAMTLGKVFDHASVRLDPISRDHAGCGCRHDADIRVTAQCDAA
jgi:hypothetical protein